MSKVLEKINCTDYELRINFLFEIARMNNRPRRLNIAMEYANKALELSNYCRSYRLQEIQNLIIDIEFN